jgi:dolichol-phosphate mannosyltransferase
MFEGYRTCPSDGARVVTPRLSIIVPTYCEAENLALLVARIDEAVRGARLDYELIVVDDDSPDGTPTICRQLERRFPLRLITRRHERGLSSAVILGMQSAQGVILLCMDADLSHPPEKIPEVVAALNDPSVDFVLGSRYVAGGVIGDDWGQLRHFKSKLATLLARPLTSVTDPMAGFFALRQSAFRQVVDQLDPIGYKIGLELMVKTRCRKVVEVPITFHNRCHGKSKLSWRQQWEYLRHLKRLIEFRYARGRKSRALSEPPC